MSIFGDCIRSVPIIRSYWVSMIMVVLGPETRFNDENSGRVMSVSTTSWFIIALDVTITALVS
jgi:hypothetical protein